MKGNSYLIGASAPCVAACLGGCSNISLLDPKGPVGVSELIVIGVAFAIMLVVVIPVIVMAVWFPRRYKASNPQGDYAPKWSYSAKIDLIVWLVPAAIVMGLGTLAWIETHKLDPFNPISAPGRPIVIDVVSLDWKWLFIYPDQQVATVNQLELPVNVPASFRITSDTVVTSFFIPQLGSQIYAMPGKESRLHLLADKPGTYIGQNQQFSGRGFADMNFKVKVTTFRQFETWIQQLKRSPNILDRAQFERLKKPDAAHPTKAYSWVEHDLFTHIVHSFHSFTGKEYRAHRIKTAASEES
ncbi:MAG: ubiquinol oxidase subunit II [Gammaproteobacteria bacterium]|jgi:cytochrome o ubiquinol oxidase subunit 2